MALSDLEDLQKVYRNMELNRKSFAEDSALVLRQQQQKLEKLRKENDDLKADVATLQMRNSHQPMTSFEQDQLTKLYEESARYRDLIESEKEMLQSMQDQITERRKQIWEHRQMTGGVNAATENQKVVEKQVRILENRLDQALVKFNKSLAHNRKLRQEIDDLRGERAAFGRIGPIPGPDRVRKRDAPIDARPNYRETEADLGAPTDDGRGQCCHGEPKGR